jgi:hypothetical protein
VDELRAPGEDCASSNGSRFMASEIVRLVSPRIGFACAALVVLTACDRGAQAPAPAAASRPATPNAEVAWARAALERNPNIEVVASDPEKEVFTIRDRRTGDVQVAKLNDLAAAPVAQMQALPSAPAELAAEAQPEATSPPPPPEAAAGQQPVAQTDAVPPQSTSSDAGYTIERSGGQLRVSGPGVSIVSSGQAGSDAQAGAVARASEPIICEGRRMLHLDNRELSVEGDAVIVRDGCEVFITNSRIVASGTGVVVRDGVVHVSNSHVEGRQGSFDVDAKSKMFVRSSTFQGVPRRDQLAMVQDQGGNRWR